MPQCSVLGELLFFVYINDQQNSTSLKVLNFADNTLIYATFKKDNYTTDTAYLKFRTKSGLPHTQGIQGNSGNFQVIENLRETQVILILFLTLGSFGFF